MTMMMMVVVVVVDSVRVDYKSGDLRVSDGGLQDEYSVAQYHFHWGSVDTQGSEHTVDCKAYPMEMHVVTFNRKYGDLERAMKREDGLAALGIFFEISSKDNPDFQPIIEALAKINRPGIVIELAPVPLRDLLPADTGRYYRYPGSITTPPCREVVTWTVFSEPVRISAKQMKAFRSLWFEDRMPDGYNNFRPVQPLNRDRIIRASFTPADETNS
nr:hypothetical protein BaRGS_027545 [Batillaria attramentaria]